MAAEDHESPPPEDVRRVLAQPSAASLGASGQRVRLPVRGHGRCLMPFPARVNEERRARAAARDIALAAAMLCDADLIGSLGYREQLIVARRYLRKDQSWAQIAEGLGLTKAQVTSAWRRIVTDERVRALAGGDDGGQAR